MCVSVGDRQSAIHHVRFDGRSAGLRSVEHESVAEVIMFVFVGGLVV